jgi:ribosomal protein S18 acetylase RimI-like enzyme
MENIEIVKLTGKDVDKFIQLIKLFENVFEMEDLQMPDSEYLLDLLLKTDFLVFGAIAGNKVVGGLTAYTLNQYYSKTPQVYIYDLAVKSTMQRKGIGKLLIAAIKDYSRNIGIGQMYVQADKIDDHAIDFYRSTGGTEQEVIHFNYYFK